jgi:hypothetical protein
MSRRLVGALLALLAAGAFAVALATSSGGAASRPPVAARLDAYVNVARRLETLGAQGPDARAAVRHLAGGGVLAAAARSGPPGALRRAAERLVAAPASHVVRVSVTRGGRRLVDVGGRFVLAPTERAVPGTRGAVVRASAQDVAGYVQLFGRLTGQAIVVRGKRGHVQARPLDLLHVPMPAQAGEIEVHGRLYAAQTFAAPGWGGESLHVTVLVPAPRP